MEELIENLIDAIKQDKRYLQFIEEEKKLEDNDVSLLLHRYQEIQEQYQDLKQYEPYISNEEVKKKLQTIKSQLSQHPIVKQYYQSYYQLNELLEEVTKLVFSNISDDIIMSGYK